jgi:hypothetical protein
LPAGRACTPAARGSRLPASSRETTSRLPHACALTSHPAAPTRPTPQSLDRKDKTHAAYWASLQVLAQHELQEAQRRDDLDQLHLAGQAAGEEARREAGLHPAVERDIEGMLAGEWAVVEACVWVGGGKGEGLAAAAGRPAFASGGPRAPRLGPCAALGACQRVGR